MTRTLEEPPARVVSPVLVTSYPLKNLAIPPVPTVTVGLPETIISPPVPTPIAVVLAEVRITASVDVLVVLILEARVRLSASVSMRIVPDPIIPELLPTVPMVNPPEASTI